MPPYPFSRLKQDFPNGFVAFDLRPVELIFFNSRKMTKWDVLVNIICNIKNSNLFFSFLHKEKAEETCELQYGCRFHLKWADDLKKQNLQVLRSLKSSSFPKEHAQTMHKSHEEQLYRVLSDTFSLETNWIFNMPWIRLLAKSGLKTTYVITQWL